MKTHMVLRSGLLRKTAPTAKTDSVIKTSTVTPFNKRGKERRKFIRGV
jgi:hypothetical protein